MKLTTAVRAYRKATRVLRGQTMAAMIRLGGGQCGPGLEAEAGTTLRWGPHAGIRLGRDVRLGRGVILDVPEGGRLVIGDGVKVMHHTVIAAFEEIALGAGSQVGESCSIRDSDHGQGSGEVSMADHNISTPTRIGDGVWIARGVAVLRGASVGEGARVGANSVVVGKYPVPSGATAVGAPARSVHG